MSFKIVRNDITKIKADAIVNTANPKPLIGSGTDSAIYAAAGKEVLLAERKKIGDIAPGKACGTDAFNLEAKYIIHTVGPAWIDGNHGERDILRSCYANSLSLAADLKCKSIAFPLIATGVNGFPKDEALNIALAEIGKFLLTHEMKVIMVVFDRASFQLSEKTVGGIEEYIGDHFANLVRDAEYEGPCEKYDGPFEECGILSVKFDSPCEKYNCRKSRSLTKAKDKLIISGLASVNYAKTQDKPDVCRAPQADMLPDISGKSLDEVLKKSSETFQQKLFRLIDASGMDDVTVYKKANIEVYPMSRTILNFRG